MVEKGKFLAQPVENSKGQSTNGNSRSSNSHFEHAKAITTLRSGKVVDNKVQEALQEAKDDPKEQLKLEHWKGKDPIIKGETPELGKATTPMVVENEVPTSKFIEPQVPTPSKCVPFLPFPQRLKKQEKK